jgi:hypothetical protein
MKHLRLLFSLIIAFAAAAPAADLSITTADFLASDAAKKEIGKAGVSITIGQLVYFDTGTSTWKLADANVAAASRVGGIAGSAAAAGQQLVIITEDPDLKLGATLDRSYPVYVLSATAGGIAVPNDLGAGGMYPHVVLIGTSATNCIFKPGLLRGTAVTLAD